MWNFTQQDRLLTIKTPLDDDFFLMDELRVKEGISQLYEIEVELLHEEGKSWTSHERDAVDVKDLLGKPVSIEVKQTTDGKIRRFFNGIVSEFSQGGRDEHFGYYWAKIVPLAWVYTQNRDSRIFQQKSVPNILKDVFKKIENKIVWELDYDYQSRNYCVQYRESDFSFASRLMEEEGIYYYFEHLEEGEHKMIISDKPRFSRDCPTMSDITYFDIGERTDYLPVIISWDTDYRLKPGKVAFRDHHIQQPNKTLFVTTPSVFDFGDNVEWEVYDYPGGYANKFDGIDPGGGEQASDLSKIMPDGKNVSKVAMEAIDSRHRIGAARSDCSTLTPGHRFKMTEHPVADVNGEYVVTSVQHTAKQWPPYLPSPESDRKAWSTEEYVNSFTAQVHGREGSLPFRPLQLTPKPTIYGAQTAAVVGPAGEEIYTDKYGRVKVRFFWDRDGQTDGSDSCWLPVAQTWAGNGWGSMFIPRVGMEVIVHFLDGDPDNPIVDGCVYHPLNMPPYAQPEHKTRSGVKTDSSKGGGGYNELRFEDKKGSEQIFIHGEKDIDVRIKNDRREWTGKDQHLIVIEDLLEKIGKDQGSHHLTIKDDQMVEMGGGHHLKVGGDDTVKIGETQTIDVGKDQGIKVGMNHSLEAGMNAYIKGGLKVVIEAGLQLSLKAGGSFIDIGPAGISISGVPLVNINSGGAAASGSPVNIGSPTAPEEPAVADNDKPGKKMELEKQSNDRKKGKSAKEDPKKKSWIELELLTEAGEPVAGERYEVKTSDGKVRKGSTNNKGLAIVKGIEPGNCEVTFPNLDQDAWKDA